MKKIIIGLCMALAFTAPAQIGNNPSRSINTFRSALNGGTNNIAHASTNVYPQTPTYFLNVSPVADPFAPTLEYLGVAITCSGSAGAAGNLPIVLGSSPTGHTNDITTLATLNVPLNGTNIVGVTNDAIFVPPAARVFIVSGANTNVSADATNLTLIWRERITSRPGR